ncbi:MAG: DNA/RNA nuclease SfsA [Eubacteriales bacterium]
MRYSHTVRGTFISRPNRFIAICQVEGRETVCHVKNTGRCRELLVPGATVILVPAENPARKTPYDLVAVYKGSRLLNMDSQIPNRAAEEFLPTLFPGELQIFPERGYRNSRFDFCLIHEGRECYLEVKGVTLEENGIFRFPDAPTERGVKHIRELIAAKREGYGAYLLFVIQMEGAVELRPNEKTDPVFAAALRDAAREGVGILAYDCTVTEDSMSLRMPVKVVL